MFSSSSLQSWVSGEEVLDWDYQVKEGYFSGGFSVRTNGFNFTVPILNPFGLLSFDASI